MAHRLLLADDSITIQKVVELVLAEEDFEIKSVNNGEDALNLMAEFQPEVVLADIDMPKMNGYQLCEKIKQNPSSSRVPVILLAGAFEPIDEELARHVGADDSVIKPFESQELISKINAALTMAEAQEDIEAEAAVAIEEGEEVFAAEAVSAEASVADEDLWAMEDVTGPAAAGEALAEEISVEEQPAEELSFEEPAEGEAFAVTEEAFAIPDVEIEEPAETVIPAPGGAEPVFAAAAATAAPAAMPAAAIEYPSKEEMLAVFRSVVTEQVSAAVSGIDLRETLSSQLVPLLKETAEKVLWEIAPELSEKVLKESLQGAVGSLSSQIEKVLWETVPDLAATMIAKEIEKIRSEF